MHQCPIAVSGQTRHPNIMDTRLVAAAIPLFAIFIGIELLVAKRRGMKVYRFSDTIADLSCGITQQLGLIVSQAPLLILYTLIQSEVGLWQWDHSLGSFALAWLLIDFCYYWWHRASHRINWLWAVHLVHHQSEDYNLAVALRQAMFTHITAMPFYVPLALLGFDVLTFGIVLSLNTLVQFWIHTEVIRKVAPLEPIFNTPSHHRVHHGINDEYLDKNYAGFLIIWDRVFGTFEPEKAEAVYGITQPLNSFNPFWANLHYFVELAQRSFNLSHWSDKLYVWWAPPEWLGQGEQKPDKAPQSRPEQIKFDVVLSPGRRALTVALFLGVMVGATAMIVYGGQMDLLALLACTAGLFAVMWGISWRLAR